MANVNDVVNRIIHLRNEMKNNGQIVSLTNLKIQKLLYFCNAMFSVSNRNGTALINNEYFYAWRYGPVIPSVYKRLSIYGQSDIPEYEDRGSDNLLPEEIEVIEQVWDNMYELDAFELVSLSHVDGGPWDQVYQENQNNIIPQELILDYFGG